MQFASFYVNNALEMSEENRNNLPQHLYYQFASFILDTKALTILGLYVNYTSTSLIFDIFIQFASFILDTKAPTILGLYVNYTSTSSISHIFILSYPQQMESSTLTRKFFGLLCASPRSTICWSTQNSRTFCPFFRRGRFHRGSK